MRWWAWTLLGLLALPVVALAGVYGASEIIIRQHHAIPDESLVADTSEAGVREGAHLVRIVGCLGCHGAKVQGRLLAERAFVGRLQAPALAPIVQRESDTLLARTIRHGVDADGRTLWGMPPRSNLSDDDTARILGFLRTLRPSPQDKPEITSFGPLGRIMILRGRLERHVRVRITAPQHRPADTGAYLVSVACTTCHDLYQERPVGPFTVSPPLADVAAAYDDDAFRHLLRTGRGMGAPRDLKEMREAAQTALAWLSDDEITAIKAYLTRKAAEPPPSDAP